MTLCAVLSSLAQLILTFIFYLFIYFKNLTVFKLWTYFTFYSFYLFCVQLIIIVGPTENRLGELGSLIRYYYYLLLLLLSFKLVFDNVFMFLTLIYNSFFNWLIKSKKYDWRSQLFHSHFSHFNRLVDAEAMKKFSKSC